MKIMVYTNSMSPAGGLERVISKHINFMAFSNQVTVLTKEPSQCFYPLPKDVLIHNLGLHYKLNPKSRLSRTLLICSHLFSTVWLLRGKLKELNPAVIYIATPLNLLELFLAKLMRAQCSLSDVIVTEHASYSAYNKVYKFIIKLLYNKVGLLCVPTKDDSNLYKEMGIKNQYLPNPLSFVPTSFSNNQQKIVLNIGRLTDDKQHSVLINIWAKAKYKDGWILKIIGSGENYSDLINQIQEMGLSDSVIICDPTKDIEGEYVSASFFVLTSRAEGFGLVLLEAMACGLPCLAFNCPSGPKDIISDGHSGFLINPGDEEMFLDRLETFLKDEALRKKFGSAARSGSLKFEEQLICKKFNNLFNRHFK